MTDDVRADARRWLDTWPGPLTLWSGSGNRDQSIPDAHNAAPELVDRLLAELDRVTAERDEWARIGGEHDIARRATQAKLDDIQAVAADVDQWGGHSGPSLARHILNIIGGEA